MLKIFNIWTYTLIGAFKLQRPCSKYYWLLKFEALCYGSLVILVSQSIFRFVERTSLTTQTRAKGDIYRVSTTRSQKQNWKRCQISDKTQSGKWRVVPRNKKRDIYFRSKFVVGQWTSHPFQPAGQQQQCDRVVHAVIELLDIPAIIWSLKWSNDYLSWMGDSFWTLDATEMGSNFNTPQPLDRF